MLKKGNSSHELEAKAVVEALKKFRVYLLGKTFKIFTDCAAFQQTMRKKDLTTRIARWALILEEYHYTIEHRPGSRSRLKHALSRYPVTMIESAHDIIPKKSSKATKLSKISNSNWRKDHTKSVYYGIKQSTNSHKIMS